MTRRSDHSPQLQSYFSACATTFLKFRTPPPDSEFCFESRQNFPKKERAMTVNLRTLTREKREVPMQRHRVRRGHRAAPRRLGRMPLGKEAARSRKIQFVYLFVLLGLLSLATQPGFAQSGPPLNFANNYFVRGDYTVAGAKGMTSNFTNINGTQYAVGTITVPDPNPGIKPSAITGTNRVPAGAEVVAAVLYWQTVEKVGVTPGQPGSGQNGFLRPLISSGPPAPGYAISGVVLSSGGTNTVSWSAGGCTSGSTGKVVRTYRANVLGALPRDPNGNISANIPYEVRLPGTASTTPIAVGASL